MSFANFDLKIANARTENGFSILDFELVVPVVSPEVLDCCRRNEGLENVR